MKALLGYIFTTLIAILLFPFAIIFGIITGFNRGRRMNRLNDVAEEAALAERVRLQIQENHKKEKSIVDNNKF